MMTHNIALSVGYNQWLIYLDTKGTNQSKLNKSPQGYKSNEIENVIIYDIGDQCNKHPNVHSLSAVNGNNINKNLRSIAITRKTNIVQYIVRYLVNLILIT